MIWNLECWMLDLECGILRFECRFSKFSHKFVIFRYVTDFCRDLCCAMIFAHVYTQLRQPAAVWRVSCSDWRDSSGSGADEW